MSYFPLETINVNIASAGALGSTDAFNRLRMSVPHTAFSAKFEYPDHALTNTKKFSTVLTGGGALNYLANESAYELQTNSLNGSRVIRESIIYVPYDPGKSTLCMLTGIIGLSKSGVISRIGFYDDNDGVYFKQSATGPSVVIRSNATGSIQERDVPQINWNIDKFDGTGPSGITLDLSKTHIFVIDLQWLGVGRVRFGFSSAGVVYWAHQFLNENLYTTVYMSTATLPVRYEIQNIASTGSPTSMKQICCSILTEGDLTDAAKFFTVSNGSTAKSVSKSVPGWTPIISIRPSIYFQSKLNRIIAKFSNVSALIASSGSAEVQYAIFENSTITGAVWTANSANSSMMEYDTSATAISGGDLRYLSFLNISGSSSSLNTSINDKNDHYIVSNRDGQTTYTLAMKSSSNNVSVYASLMWKEVW